MTNDASDSPDGKPWKSYLNSITVDTSFLNDVGHLSGDYLSTVSAKLIQDPIGSIAAPVSSFVAGAALSSVADLSMPSATAFNITDALSLHSESSSSFLENDLRSRVSSGVSPFTTTQRPEYEDISSVYEIATTGDLLAHQDYLTPASILGSTAFDNILDSLTSLEVGSLNWSPDLLVPTGAQGLPRQ